MHEVEMQPEHIVVITITAKGPVAEELKHESFYLDFPKYIEDALLDAMPLSISRLTVRNNVTVIVDSSVA